MTVVYFDSSAFVKLLVEEPGSELAAQLWDGCDAAVSSRLAYPEVRAALAAAGRAGHLKPAQLRRAVAAWDEFWAATRAVELTDSVAVHAGDLAGRYSLRGADAVHLASLLAIGAEDMLFAVWDQRLRVGASAAGVHVLPESPYPTKHSSMWHSSLTPGPEDSSCGSVKLAVPHERGQRGAGYLIQSFAPKPHPRPDLADPDFSHHQ